VIYSILFDTWLKGICDRLGQRVSCCVQARTVVLQKCCWGSGLLMSGGICCEICHGPMSTEERKWSSR